MTPGVRQFVRVVVPATLGAGVYQISAFIDTFFLTRIGTGAMSYFNYADRLNQLPLGVIGAALGTAILPQVSRHVGAGEPARRPRPGPGGRAGDAAVPARRAGAGGQRLAAGRRRCSRAAASPPRMRGSRRWRCRSSSLGLPAYVLVKVLTPGFYSRQDTATPVKIAVARAGRERSSSISC